MRALQIGNTANEPNIFKNIGLVKEMTDAEYDLVMEKAFEFWKGKSPSDSRGQIHEIEDKHDFLNVFGMPYTSTSNFAAFWADCNYEIQFQGGKVDFFSLDKHGQVIMGVDVYDQGDQQDMEITYLFKLVD